MRTLYNCEEICFFVSVFDAIAPNLTTHQIATLDSGQSISLPHKRLIYNIKIFVKTTINQVHPLAFIY